MTADLKPRRHEPPPEWPAETFEKLSDALARALVAAYRRAAEQADAAAVARESITQTVGTCEPEHEGVA